MVLAELGTKITQALRKLNSQTIIDDKALGECLTEISIALLNADVNIKHVAKLKDSVNTQVKLLMQKEKGSNIRRLIQQTVISELTRMLDPEKKPVEFKKGEPNVVMFVGLQGSGKTTTCTKYAYYYQKRGWRVALVCADTFRAGAFDQLKMNAAKIKVPFYGSYSETDPVKIAKEGVEHFTEQNFEIIIVDTSGRHKQETALFDEMKQVEAVTGPNEIIFVMDSSIGQACYDQASAFRKTVKVGSVIITKLDGHAKGGGALSAIAATESPIVFIGTGEHFDDFESFQAGSFIKRLLGLGDLPVLMETVKKAIPQDKQNEMINRMQQGQFSLRDLREQFQSVMNMGPLNQIIGMIPGLNANLIPKGKEKESVARLKRFLYIMDSMTNEELDGVKQMNDSRAKRVAKGSGTSFREVNELLEEYKRFAKMVGNLGGKKGGDLNKMARNPIQMMRQVQNMVDPRILKQMGGAGNLMNMVKEMGKADGMGGMGGMGGLGDLASGMGGMEGMGNMMNMLGGAKKGGRKR